jgi:3-oxoacyl-[acyl-carrier-protein] synthase-3
MWSSSVPEAVLSPFWITDPAPSSELETAPRPARTAAILSVATELPEHRLTSAAIAEQLGVTEEWILSRTGIRERRQALPHERLSDYAARAGTKALQRAGVDPAEIDLVIVCTLSQDEVTPNTAPIVAHEVGAHNAGALDVGAACTAFLSGLALTAAQIESGRVDRVLLIGADFITRITDYEDKQTAPLFGDAAGAVVVGAVPADSDAGSIGPIVLGSDGSHARTIFAPLDTRKVEMDGQEVFRNAVNRMSEVTVQAVDRAGVTLDEIDLFVYHQANARITKAVGERLGLPADRVVDCIAMFGNSSAATLPLALVAAELDGRLKPGSRVLISAFGAGFVWGGGVIEWGVEE